MNVDEVSRKLYVLRETRKDKLVLDAFINNLGRYRRIVEDGFEDPEDIALLKHDSSAVFSILYKWNDNPLIYHNLKQKLDEVRKFKSFLEGKLKGTNIQALNKANGASTSHSRTEEQIPDKKLEEQVTSIISQVQKNIQNAVSEQKSGSALEENVLSISADYFSPSLKQLSCFYSDYGLVGNVETSLLMTLGATNKLCFGIKSLSGSGKTVALDILVKLLSEDNVYLLKQASDKAFLYDADSVNKAKVIVLTELQKSATKTMIDVLKDLGEGKAAERKVTNQERNGVTSQEIKSDKSVIYTLAVENWFKEDKELERRYFTLSTDISTAHIENVLMTVAEKAYLGKKSRKLSDAQEKELVRHVRFCLDYEPQEYINAFAPKIAESMPKNVKSMSFIKHYFNLVNSCTKFHYPERFADAGALFTSLQDVYYIDVLYSKKMDYSVRNISFFEESVLALFEKSGKALDFQDVHQLIAGQFSLDPGAIKETLDNLVNMDYLKSDFCEYRNCYLKIEHPERNWKEYFDAAYKIINDNYPEITEKWKYSQMTGNKIIAENPFTGEKVVLVDFSEKKEVQNDSVF